MLRKLACVMLSLALAAGLCPAAALAGGGAAVLAPAPSVSIADAAVSAAAQVYTGDELEPAPVVTLGGRTLVEGEDYTASYEDNVGAGTATVAVTGKGRYYGEASGTFEIAKAANPVGKLSGKRAKVTASRWGSVKVKPSKAFKGLGRAKGKLRFKKLKGTKRIVVNRRTGRLSVKEGTRAGTYKLKVRVKARGNANYRPGKKTVTVKVRVKSPRVMRTAGFEFEKPAYWAGKVGKREGSWNGVGHLLTVRAKGMSGSNDGVVSIFWDRNGDYERDRAQIGVGDITYVGEKRGQNYTALVFWGIGAGADGIYADKSIDLMTGGKIGEGSYTTRSSVGTAANRYLRKNVLDRLVVY